MDRTAGRLRVLAGYIAIFAVAVGGYLVIRAAGSDLVPGLPALQREVRAEAFKEETLAHVLLALAAITLAARGTGIFFQRRLHQPPVMGEIVAGLAMGPSLLGAVLPDFQAFLLPAAATPFVGMIAKVGVVLFMFLVGLDLDLGDLRKSSRATVVISHASIFVPFLLGSALALWLYPIYAAQGVTFTVFSLFLGVSMSVTAFPVLARILIDRGLQRTRIGSMALACAAVDDASAWTLLAFVAGVATSRTAGAGWTLVGTALWIAAMVWIARPLLHRLAAREERRDVPLSRNVLGVVFVSLLLSGAATEFIGIHALFGSFLLGAVMKRDGRLAEQIRVRMEDLVAVLLLPAFFVYTGLRTQVGLLHTAGDWLACVAIIGVATAGKFGGSYVAARVVGFDRRESGAIGVLMNTRGLMELVVLDLGLEMGVISPTLFAMLVIMALVTTFSTTPILNLILGDRGLAD